MQSKAQINSINRGNAMPARARKIEVNTADLLVTSLDDGQLEVREVRVVDGAPVYHRRVISPGDNTTAETGEIKQIVARLHSPARVTAFLADRIARRALVQG